MGSFFMQNIIFSSETSRKNKETTFLTRFGGITLFYKLRSKLCPSQYKLNYQKTLKSKVMSLVRRNLKHKASKKISPEF
jgi:hypothetical protein